MRHQYLASSLYAATALVVLSAACIATNNRWGIVFTILAQFAAWASAYLGDAGETERHDGMRIMAFIMLVVALFFAAVALIVLAMS